MFGILRTPLVYIASSQSSIPDGEVPESINMSMEGLNSPGWFTAFLGHTCKLRSVLS